MKYQTCFLIMQCAEKIPEEFTGLIDGDLKKYVIPRPPI